MSVPHSGKVQEMYQVSTTFRKCGTDMIRFLYLSLHDKLLEMSVFFSSVWAAAAECAGPERGTFEGNMVSVKDCTDCVRLPLLVP